MTIKSLTLRDWKGLTGTFDLSPRTILAGPNGAGKSGILDAYRVLVTGYTALGKTPSATHALSSGKTTEVSGVVDGGSILSRRFERKGANVAQTITLDGTEVKVSDFVPPPALTIPAEAMHPNEFLVLSGDKRAAWLSANLDASVGAVAPDVFPAIETAVGKIGYDDPVEKALAAMAEKERVLKVEVELCQANLKRLMGQDMQLPAGTLAEWETKLAAADEELEALSREQAGNAERAKLASAKVTRSNNLRDQLRRVSASRDGAELKVRDLVKRAAALPPDVDPKVGEALLSELDDLSVKGRVGVKEIQRLRNSIQMVRQHGKCPCCGTAAGLLKDAIDDWDFTAAGLEGEQEAIAQRMDVIRKELTAREAGVKAAQTRRELAAAIVTTEDEIKRLTDQMADLQAELDAAEADTDMPAVTTPEVLTVRIEGLRTQKAQAQDSVRKFAAAQSIAGARLRAEEDRQANEKKLETVKGLVVDLKKARDAHLAKMTDAIGAPFRTAVEAAFPGCGAFLQIVSEKGKPEVDFGIERAGRRISFETLSGGEKLAVLAALVAALQIARCGRPRVCLLEMAEADSARLDAVAAACDAIGFDQVVLATCQPIGAAVASRWQVLDMGVRPS